MKLRARVDAYICGVYRKGVEMDIYGNPADGGEVFEVPDDTEVNTDVFEIVEPPAAGAAHVAAPVAEQVGLGDKSGRGRPRAS